MAEAEQAFETLLAADKVGYLMAAGTAGTGNN